MHNIYGYIRGIHSYELPRKRDLLTQRLAIRRYSRRLRDLYPHLTPPEIYSDVGMPRAGQNIRSLPGGRELLMKIRRGDHLVIGHFGRVFATSRDCLRNLRIWRQQGITVHFAQKNLRMNVNAPGGQLLVRILEELVDGHVLRLQEAMTARKRAKRQKEILAEKRAYQERQSLLDL